MSTAPITWIVTTADAAWQQQDPVTASPLTRMPDVFVGVDDPRQAIEGFGASFNELGWTALELLDEHRFASGGVWLRYRLSVPKPV